MRHRTTRDDTDITSAAATHHYGRLAFEAVTQDRRQYYRMTVDGRGAGSLTDAGHARETIAYWRGKGWTV